MKVDLYVLRTRIHESREGKLILNGANKFGEGMGLIRVKEGSVNGRFLVH